MLAAYLEQDIRDRSLYLKVGIRPFCVISGFTRTVYHYLQIPAPRNIHSLAPEKQSSYSQDTREPDSTLKSGAHVVL